MHDPLTTEDNEFFTKLLMTLGHDLLEKVRLGKVEYGGHIWQKDPIFLIEEAEKEFIDGYVYTYSALAILKILLQDPAVQKKVVKIQQDLMHNKAEENKNENPSVTRKT